jgi:hypothetical protein
MAILWMTYFTTQPWRPHPCRRRRAEGLDAGRAFPAIPAAAVLSCRIVGGADIIPSNEAYCKHDQHPYNMLNMISCY